MKAINSLLLVLFHVVSSADLPTLYEYYVRWDNFRTLGTRTLLHFKCGSVHYFRVPPQYWRDRLRKVRAAGLNTIETYISWNLHEPENGVWDFGKGGTEMEQFLDLETFLKMAQEEDLFVIVRPGPYICAEWEWGGFPSWLLREEDIQVRTSDPKYLAYVQNYLEAVSAILSPLTFKNGGPIIAVQVENEYGSAPVKDLDYVERILSIFQENGIDELFVSSDSASSGTSGSLPGKIFQTVNFAGNAQHEFDKLLEFQPNQPVMAMEYWTGWYDHWSEVHHLKDNTTFLSDYESILSYPASVNMYMFHGGTNFGFLNGANIIFGDNSGFQPTTSSYDYDAPLTEAGDYTSKYYIVKELIEQYNPVKTLTPDLPPLIERVEYPDIQIETYLSYDDLIEQAPFLIPSEKPMPMELLPINNDSGQSYGYIVYRKENIDVPANAVLTIGGHVRDSVMVLVNGQLISKPLTSSKDLNGFGYYRLKNSNITLSDTDLQNATVDLVIENWGRANFGNLYQQFKGLLEENIVYLNGEELSSWVIIPLEFKKVWNQGLSGWKSIEGVSGSGPGLYKATLTIDDDPRDTYIDMDEWDKGVVIVNGFVLGRHALVGPQQTLYLPGPFLQTGDNEIIIFEQFKAASRIRFSKDAFYKTV